MGPATGRRGPGTSAPDFHPVSHDYPIFRDTRYIVSSQAPLSMPGAVDTAPAVSKRSRLMRFLVGGRPLAALLQAMSTQALVIGINILTGVLTARSLGPDGGGGFAA